jgi:hypothetical protein
MHRRSLIVIGLLLVLAVPLSASQFITLPFDQVARESTYVVRGNIEKTWSQWDDAHEVIFTYAMVRVTRYFGETTGPDMLVVREAGGTVGDYTQEAIGFPMLRRGEDVVLMLSRWEDSADFRIHAFNQGKYLVRDRGGVQVLVEDPVKQGDERLGSAPGHGAKETAIEGPSLTIDEFAAMVDAARAGADRAERPRQ